MKHLSKLALGIIETVGLAAAVEAADAAVKSANVTLIGYENSKGSGLITIKLEGDVGAVKAAIEAGCAAARKINKVWSKQVIPRPHEEIQKLIYTKDTVGTKKTDSINSIEEINKVQDVELSHGDSPLVQGTISSVEDEAVGNEAKDEIKEEANSSEVCNICGDLACTRKKGDLKSLCLHYEEEKKE